MLPPLPYQAWGKKNPLNILAKQAKRAKAYVWGFKKYVSTKLHLREFSMWYVQFSLPVTGTNSSKLTNEMHVKTECELNKFTTL